MKLLLSVLALQSFVVGLTSAAGSGTFSSWIQSNASLVTTNKQLVYANGSVYFGDIIGSLYSQPLIISYPGGAPGKVGEMSFTSFHTAPTGWQRFVIYPNDTLPVAFTLPHSGIPPAPGGTTQDFTVGVADTLLRHGDYDGWYGCLIPIPESSYQLYYIGEGMEVPAGCVEIEITTYGYGNCPW